MLWVICDCLCRCELFHLASCISTNEVCSFAGQFSDKKTGAEISGYLEKGQILLFMTPHCSAPHEQIYWCRSKSGYTKCVILFPYIPLQRGTGHTLTLSPKSFEAFPNQL